MRASPRGGYGGPARRGSGAREPAGRRLHRSGVDPRGAAARRDAPAILPGTRSVPCVSVDADVAEDRAIGVGQDVAEVSATAPFPTLQIPAWPELRADVPNAIAGGGECAFAGVVSA